MIFIFGAIGTMKMLSFQFGHHVFDIASTLVGFQ